MDDSSRDALAETYEVLTGLMQFLSAVGDTGQFGCKAKLKAIEDSIADVVDKIGDLNQQERSGGHSAKSGFTTLRCV